MKIRAAIEDLKSASRDVLDALPLSISRVPGSYVNGWPEEGMPVSLTDEGYRSGTQGLRLTTRRADYYIYLRAPAWMLRPVVRLAA